MNASKGTEVRTKRGPCALAGAAMDLALAVTLILPRPFAHTRGNRVMTRMAAAITPPFVGREQGAAWGHVVGHERVAGLPIRVDTDPQALLAHVTRDNADDGRPIIARGAMPFARIGAPAWWIGGVAKLCAFFPGVLVSSSASKAVPRMMWGDRRVHIGLEALPR
jgi:hypothetical protein